MLKKKNKDIWNQKVISLLQNNCFFNINEFLLSSYHFLNRLVSSFQFFYWNPSINKFYKILSLKLNGLFYGWWLQLFPISGPDKNGNPTCPNNCPQPGATIHNTLISLLLSNRPNRLECVSLASLSSLVWCLLVRPGPTCDPHYGRFLALPTD